VRDRGGYGVETHRFDDLEQLERFLREAGAATGPRLAVVPQLSQR